MMLECDKKDFISKMIDSLLLVQKTDGRTFIARLIGIDGDELYFENKKGLVSMVRRAMIYEMTVVG